MAADEVAATPPPRRRRWLRWLLVAVGVLVVAAIALPYFFLPRLARPALERALSAALDAPVSIGALSWEPANGRVTAGQIRIGADQDANRATVARVVGEVRLDRLWRREIVVARVAVVDPVGVVELDARYRPAMLPQDDDGAAGSILPQVTIEQLEVTGGLLTVRYPVKERLHDKLLRLTRLDASDIAVTADGVTMHASLEGALDDAPLNAQVRLAIDEIDVDLAVSGLPVHRDALDLPPGLETFHAIVDAQAHYQSRAARATNTGTEARATSHTVQLDVRLEAPSITDAAGSALSAAAIVVPDARIDLLTGAMVADHVTVEKPVGAVELDAQYRPALPRFGESGPATTDPPDVTIRELVVTDGELTVRYPVRDKTRAVPLRVTRMQASDIKAAGGALALRAELEGSLDGAPLTGRVDLGGAQGPIEAEVRLSGLAVDAGTIALPAGLETFAATVDVKAAYAKQTAPASETVRLDARLDGPRLSGEAKTELRAKAVALPDARFDLATRAVELGTVRVTAPVIDLALTPDGLVLPAPRGDGAAEPAWNVRSGRIELRDGQLRVHRGASELTLRLQSVDWDGLAGGAGPLALRATIAAGGTIAVAGRLGTDPLAAALDVTLAGVPVPPLADLAAVLPVRLSKGTGEGKLRVVYEADHLRVHGDVRVRDLHTMPPDPKRPVEVMAVADAEAELAIETNAATAIDIRSIKLSYPYLLAQRHRDGLFPADLLTATASPSGDGSPKAADATVRIRRLEVEGGKVEFLDITLEPDYWTSLSAFTAEASEIRLPAATIGSFSIAGRQDELSPIEITGTLGAEGLEARASVQDVLLPSLNAYVSPLLGYDLTAGRLGFDVTVAPAPPLLAATATVILRGVEVRQTGLDIIQKQSGVPLPIALSLISKRSGEIDLTFPVTVDTKARRFTLGSIVGQAVRNAIVTALTSPLRILGNLFGSNGAPHAFAIDPIPFAPGSGTLDPAGAARLAEIARILHAHPGLVLVALPQITAEDLGMIGDEAQELADQRGDAVHNALTGDSADPRLPPERLTLVPWKPPSGAPPSDQPGVYVELQDQP